MYMYMHMYMYMYVYMYVNVYVYVYVDVYVHIDIHAHIQNRYISILMCMHRSVCEVQSSDAEVCQFLLRCASDLFEGLLILS